MLMERLGDAGKPLVIMAAVAALWTKGSKNASSPQMGVVDRSIATAKFTPLVPHRHQQCGPQAGGGQRHLS